MKRVLEYLEQTAKLYADKPAVTDLQRTCTYGELLQRAKAVGTALAGKVELRNPVGVYMEKGADALEAFLGICYAGAFYIFLNPELPDARICSILEISGIDMVITSGKYEDKLMQTGYQGRLLNLAMVPDCIDEKLLKKIEEQALDTDPLYANFTSGSTGKPKGVLVGHRSVLDFIDVFTETFSITGDDVIGNQAPFDFDVSVKDIYSALKTGARLVVIPKAYFSVPTQLLDYICEENVTTLIWAVSALCMVTALKGFMYRIPEKVSKVLFSGEKMPLKHLKKWQKALPEAEFVNLYGPTEITCNCTFYRVPAGYERDALPIGRAFPNEQVFLLDEQDQLITEKDRPGEICVSGTALAIGYYRNPGETAKHFVQNPLNDRYYERIYRTGDLGLYGEDGELYFIGRKDFQIKHMGHRIELEEIETAMYRIQGVEHCCCIFSEKQNKILSVYSGIAGEVEIRTELSKELPEYMIPNIFKQLSQLPLKNGKIDRSLLKSMWEERRL